MDKFRFGPLKIGRCPSGPASPCGRRGLTRKRCGTDRDVFLEGFHVGFRRCVYANLALLKDANFAVITSKFSFSLRLDIEPLRKSVC